MSQIPLTSRTLGVSSPIHVNIRQMHSYPNHLAKMLTNSVNMDLPCSASPIPANAMEARVKAHAIPKGSSVTIDNMGTILGPSSRITSARSLCVERASPAHLHTTSTEQSQFNPHSVSINPSIQPIRHVQSHLSGLDAPLQHQLVQRQSDCSWQELPEALVSHFLGKVLADHFSWSRRSSSHFRLVCQSWRDLHDRLVPRLSPSSYGLMMHCGIGDPNYEPSGMSARFSSILELDLR